MESACSLCEFGTSSCSTSLCSSAGAVDTLNLAEMNCVRLPARPVAALDMHVAASNSKPAAVGHNASSNLPTASSL